MLNPSHWSGMWFLRKGEQLERGGAVSLYLRGHLRVLILLFRRCFFAGFPSRGCNDWAFGRLHQDKAADFSTYSPATPMMRAVFPFTPMDFPSVVRRSTQV
jgi:hypothetical protein